jgi:hypothetical protein
MRLNSAHEEILPVPDIVEAEHLLWQNIAVVMRSPVTGSLLLARLSRLCPSVVSLARVCERGCIAHPAGGLHQGGSTDVLAVSIDESGTRLLVFHAEGSYHNAGRQERHGQEETLYLSHTCVPYRR